MQMWRIPIAILYFAGVLGAADHVRVILDNSGSMKHNDRPRLATLATLLLYDLADPVLTRGDTFEVLTFDPRWPSRLWTSGVPPVQSGPRIKAIPDRRAMLADALKAIPYSANNTYYYPIIKEALTDLKGTPGGTTDRRVIVLITDGLPEDPDPSLIARDLISELEPNHIRLYVIAFGPEASRQEGTLRSILTGRGVAEPLIDRDGSNLLSSMIKIFSRSFGYSYENPAMGNSPIPLVLDSGQAPARVAVVVYWPKLLAPALNLSPPENGILNVPEGIQTGQETGAAYRVAWVIRPNPGSYRLAPDSPGALVAVLRPAMLLMNVVPQPPLTQTQVTMARREFPLRIMTRLAGGLRGDPGEDLTFQAQIHGPMTPGGYEWNDRILGAQIPNGTSNNGDGRYYDISPAFPADNVGDREFYEGWLTAEVKRGEATLGSTRQRILVYPYMKLSPTPPVASAMVGGQVQPIHSRETGCSRFEFRLDGTLAHPNRPVYALRAVVKKPAADPDPRLMKARFTLDGVPVDYADSVSDSHSPWYTGRKLTRDALLGSHEFCLVGGTPGSMDLGPVVEIPLQFEIMEAPYDSLQSVEPIVEPMRLRALIAPPAFFEKYSSWIAAALGLCSVLLIAWFTRYRAALPPKLTWAVARADSGSGPVAATLADGPLIPRLLGLRAPKIAYVNLAGGAWELGRVRPVDSELYEFWPASGVTVDHTQQEGTNSQLLTTRRTYHAKTAKRGDYVFRLEYESP